MRVAAISGTLAVALFVLVGASPSSGASAGPATQPTASPWATHALVIVQLSSPGGAAPSVDALAHATGVIGARLTAYGAPARVAQIPEARVRIEVADAAQRTFVERLATAPGVMVFVPIPPDQAGTVVEGGPLPSSIPGAPLLSAHDVVHATVGTTATGQPTLDIQLDQQAADRFDQYAAAHSGERFAVVLDDVVVSAPTINATDFHGHISIGGAFDEQAVHQLAAILEGGVLDLAARIMTVCPAAIECPVASPVASPLDGPVPSAAAPI